MHALKTIAIVAALLPAFAIAKSPPQGSYLLGGIQTICVVADGTWYGESFGPWSGNWNEVGKTLLMRGNYSSGNDAMNFTGSKADGYNGDWQEWHTDKSYEYAAVATLVFQSSSCTSPAALVNSDQFDPAR